MKSTGSEEKNAKLILMISMLIFGTIGIFRKQIPLSSGMIAFSRGAIGTLFLLLMVLIRGSKISFGAIRKNLMLLCFSGIFIGFNWILLFEAFRYTSVATATLSYYMAPIFVILASPFLLKEKLTAKKIICVIIALVGMAFVSGVFQTGISNKTEIKGILFGLAAAVLYAGVILLNKKISEINAYDKTIMQLFIAAVVLLPYTLLTEDLTGVRIDPTVIIMLVIVGVLHTGVSYALYFGSMRALKAQTIALFSYIDPVAAIFFSAIFLKEGLGIYGIVGAVLVLGSTLLSEL